MKCGAELPPVGECTACSITVSTPVPAPSLLDKDISIDRRRTPERTPAVPGPAAVPSFSELDSDAITLPSGPGAMTSPLAAPSPATPPGMIPRSATPQQPMPAVAAPAFTAPRTPTPPAFPRAEVPAAPAAPQAPAPPAMASSQQLPPAAPSPQPQMVVPPTGGLPRPVPTPVPVVTFSPPARPHAPAAELDQEPQTPPTPTPAPLPAVAGAAPEARPRTAASAVRSAARGEHEVHARPASLWRRLLSFSIDAATIVGVSALYITLASTITGLQAPSSAGLTALDSVAAWMNALKSVLVPGAILVLVLATVYCAVAAFLWNGRTLGRMVLGLRLVDTHGLAPAPTRAVLRALLSVVSFGLFLGGFWMALFDRRGQTLHDKLTSTFVIQPS